MALNDMSRAVVHIVWDSDEEPHDLPALKTYPQHEVNIMAKTSSQAQAKSTDSGKTEETGLATEFTTKYTTEYTTEFATKFTTSRGVHAACQHDNQLVDFEDKSTSAGEDSNQALATSKNRKRQRKRKDSLSHRMRYRRLVDTMLVDAAAAPGFVIDWSVLPGRITNDTWLLNKLVQRIEKHQEELRSNLVSL
jgi:hypothetical protein